MKLWVIGDDDGGLVDRLERYLPLEICASRPDGNNRHAVVWGGAGLDNDIVANPGNELVVLVEPGWMEHDRVTRLLAGVERPRLEVIEHVAAEIQAERTWALTLSLLAGSFRTSDAIHAESPAHSNLVTGPPSGESWLKVRPPVSPHGLTLGSIGFRPMAWRIASWAAGMGMRVVYTPWGASEGCATDRERAALKSGATEVTFGEVLAAADVLVLDLEYADDSIRLLDSAELALMPPGAYLVNTAHGRVIDEGALIQALRDGRFAGVALDRFNYEPLPEDSPLRQFDVALLTPGIAAPGNDAILERMAQRVAALVSGLDADVPVRRVRRVRPRASSARRG